MTSILTNNSAMVALQTLKATNAALGQTQSEIATGKSIASAKDNAAVWAISKVMESDVAGFRAISDSLSLGEASVGVASAAAEQVVDILKDIKELAVQGTSESADFTKIQNDIAARTAQITSVVAAAQFNGANLLATDVDGSGATGLTVLSSLDRSGGTVTQSTISIASVDFEALDIETNLTAITDAATAATALGEIETFLNGAGGVIEGAAALGSAAMRLEQQNDFVGKLMDSMKSGIGTLVDADMEEASARLQALQTQQQLGIQALSIANQAPQNVLSLFR